MTRLAAILSAVCVVCLIAGTALIVWSRQGGDPCNVNSVAGGFDALGGPFELVNGEGETVTNTDVIDGPTLIYFGYTFCPDVCPFDAARNAEAVDLLAEQGIDVTPVFITIDPMRDTPEIVQEFTGYMHEDMIGLTGSDAQVRQAMQAYRVYGQRRGEDDATYLMDHSVFSYLVTPEDGTIAYFRGAPGAAGSGETSQEVADAIACQLG
ncbi:SCO1/SenC [Rhodobacteraceae bacterium THAF1]|uniref:SCO family protein n=1 Tax=Palleronia sp. THAF1 TaxID=2587842 RepID=UPI000F3BDC31|nr:SCO family protein [Palleronia sp. THAF1]QFU10132.1 SCO1/SenC family protein [Palleronia sp. THAF1]VDC16963.1 SCO1/SenC [Rhodobacteraceae bacterium THAF1]